MKNMGYLLIAIFGLVLNASTGVGATGAEEQSGSQCFDTCYNQKLQKIRKANPSVENLPIEQYTAEILRPIARACAQKCL